MSVRAKVTRGSALLAASSAVVSIVGADFSAAQGAVDYVELEQGNAQLAEPIVFITSKATEGNGYRDPYFALNWAACRAHGFLRGAYHFAHPDQVPITDAILESEFHRRVIEQSGGLLDEDIPSVLDIEEASRVQTGEPFVRWCVDWLDRQSEISGRLVGVYCGGPFFDAHAKGCSAELLDRFVNYWLWLAAYVKEPEKFIPDVFKRMARGFTVWQQGGDIVAPGDAVLHLPGVGHGKVAVDKDRYYGTRAGLVDFIASTVRRVPSPTLETEKPIEVPTAEQVIADAFKEESS